MAFPTSYREDDVEIHGLRRDPTYWEVRRLIKEMRQYNTWCNREADHGDLLACCMIVRPVDVGRVIANVVASVCGRGYLPMDWRTHQGHKPRWLRDVQRRLGLFGYEARSLALALPRCQTMKELYERRVATAWWFDRFLPQLGVHIPWSTMIDW